MIEQINAILDRLGLITIQKNNRIFSINIRSNTIHFEVFEERDSLRSAQELYIITENDINTYDIMPFVAQFLDILRIDRKRFCDVRIENATNRSLVLDISLIDSPNYGYVFTEREWSKNIENIILPDPLSDDEKDEIINTTKIWLNDLISKYSNVVYHYNLADNNSSSIMWSNDLSI